MARPATVAGVHLITSDQGLVRVGVLTRDATGAIAFVIDEAYLQARNRPTLSLSWIDVEGEEATRKRLSARGDKIGLNGYLPPWFAGLLPEGALRQLVEAEMGPGDHDQLDILIRLGADLPGAVVVLPESAELSAGPAMRWETVGAFEAPRPQGLVKFSLAGVQLKFAAQSLGGRLTVPADAGEGRVILKVPTRHYPRLPEAEYTAMSLCRAAGVNTAPVRLVPTSSIDGIPARLMDGGEFALAVERFDRREGGARVHMEDAAQVIGAVGERKYTMANSETVLHMIARFSAEWRTDVLEGMRRLAADVLIGNGDNHLKNWSFTFPDEKAARLSPAYDIVPTALYIPGDRLALTFAGTATPEAIGLGKFRRVGAYLGIGEDLAEREIRQFAQACLDLWPGLIGDMPLGREEKARLLTRMDDCRLVQEVRAGRLA